MIVELRASMVPQKHGLDMCFAVGWEDVDGTRTTINT